MIREYPTNHFRFFGIRKGLCRIFGIIGTMGFSHKILQCLNHSPGSFSEVALPPLCREAKIWMATILVAKAVAKVEKDRGCQWDPLLKIYIYTIPGGDCYWLGDTSNEICSGWVM